MPWRRALKSTTFLARLEAFKKIYIFADLLILLIFNLPTVFVHFCPILSIFIQYFPLKNAILDHLKPFWTEFDHFKADSYVCLVKKSLYLPPEATELCLTLSQLCRCTPLPNM